MDEKWVDKAQCNAGWRAPQEDMIAWIIQKLEDRKCVTTVWHKFSSYCVTPPDGNTNDLGLTLQTMEYVTNVCRGAFA